MENKGSLIVISGFSGTGKGTVVRELVSRFGYKVSVSATTRPQRDGEENGKEYFFLTREEFECMINDGQLIEWTVYVGNYYGTPKDYVESEIACGNHVILEIEMQGALRVKEQYPEALLIFIAPPGADELRKRLIGRNTESMEVIEKRLSRASEEVAYMRDYEYLVVNDSVDTCVETIHQIQQISGTRMAANFDFTEKLKRDFHGFSKGEH